MTAPWSLPMVTTAGRVVRDPEAQPNRLAPGELKRLRSIYNWHEAKFTGVTLLFLQMRFDPWCMERLLTHGVLYRPADAPAAKPIDDTLFLDRDKLDLLETAVLLLETA